MSQDWSQSIHDATSSSSSSSASYNYTTKSIVWVFELIIWDRSDEVENTPSHHKLNFRLCNAHMCHLPPHSLLGVKMTTNQFSIREVIANLAEKGPLKVNTDIGWHKILYHIGEPIKHLPISLICLAGHKDPHYRNICLDFHIKDHDDEALVEWMGDHAKGSINKHLKLEKRN